MMTPCRASVPDILDAVLSPSADDVLVPTIATRGCGSGNPISPTAEIFLGACFFSISLRAPSSSSDETQGQRDRRSGMSASHDVAANLWTIPYLHRGTSNSRSLPGDEFGFKDIKGYSRVGESQSEPRQCLCEQVPCGKRCDGPAGTKGMTERIPSTGSKRHAMRAERATEMSRPVSTHSTGLSALEARPFADARTTAAAIRTADSRGRTGAV